MFKNLDASALGVTGQQSEILELALTYGFSGIDLNIAEFAARVRQKGMAYAKRSIASARIRVGTFALPVECDADDECYRRQMEKLPEYIDCAAELGCTRATILLAPAGDRQPYHENFESHRRRLHDIGSLLEPAGIRLAVGFQAAEHLGRNRAFQFIHDLDALVLLLDMVGKPNVGLLLDTWEVTACGSSLDAVRKLSANQIVAVQVADMPAGVPASELDEKSRLLPGIENGCVDVAGFLGLLREMKYDGPVTLKVFSGEFHGKRREAAVKQASESLDSVMRAPVAELSATA